MSCPFDWSGYQLREKTYIREEINNPGCGFHFSLVYTDDIGERLEGIKTHSYRQNNF